jgi:hypothetical protein
VFSLSCIVEQLNQMKNNLPLDWRYEPINFLFILIQDEFDFSAVYYQNVHPNNILNQDLK